MGQAKIVFLIYWWKHLSVRDFYFLLSTTFFAVFSICILAILGIWKTKESNNHPKILFCRVIFI